MNFNPKEIEAKARLYKPQEELSPELQPFAKLLPTLLADKEIDNAYKKRESHRSAYGELDPSYRLEFYNVIEKKLKSGGFKKIDDWNVVQVVEYIVAKKENRAMERVEMVMGTPQGPQFSDHRVDNEPIEIADHHHKHFIPPAVKKPKETVTR